MSLADPSTEAVRGVEHWTRKGDVRLFLFEKFVPVPAGLACRAGCAARAAGPRLDDGRAADFDLQVPGRPEYSVMDYFARLGYDVWTLDNEGYGRSDKHRDNNSRHRHRRRRPGGGRRLHRRPAWRCAAVDLWHVVRRAKAGLFAQRQPGRVRGLVLDGFVWTGEGSPTLDQPAPAPRRVPRQQPPPDRRSSSSGASSRATIPARAHDDVVDVFAREVCKLDDVRPERHLRGHVRQPAAGRSRRGSTAAGLILRGEWDGIAARGDLLAFFARLPNAEQVVRGDAGHRSRQPAREEPPDRPALPGGLLRPARTRVC